MKSLTRELHKDGMIGGEVGSTSPGSSDNTRPGGRLRQVLQEDLTTQVKEKLKRTRGQVGMTAQGHVEG